MGPGRPGGLPGAGGARVSAVRDLPPPLAGEGFRAVLVATATSKLTSASATTGVHLFDDGFYPGAEDLAVSGKVAADGEKGL